MGRAPCCDKANVKKGPWSPEEDAKLKDFIEKSGTCGNWIALPQKAGLKRCGKSCRLRWLVLANDWHKDWHNLSRILGNHEASKDHIDCMTKWIELERRLQKNKTIDESLQVEINKEKEHLMLVLKRIIVLVRRLAKNNLAFRGDYEKLYVANNDDNFLQMIEMIVEFDPIMQEHIQCIQAHEIHYRYLGPKIQNELVQMLEHEVKSSIITKVKIAKYYSIIVDFIPDASHKEQMSLVIRCVDNSTNSVVVEEYWIEFLKVDDTSWHGLFTKLLDVLGQFEFSIDDIRVNGMTIDQI